MCLRAHLEGIMSESRVPISIDYLVERDVTFMDNLEPFDENWRDAYMGCRSALDNLRHPMGSRIFPFIQAIKCTFRQIEDGILHLFVKIHLKELAQDNKGSKEAKFETEILIDPKIPLEEGKFNKRSFYPPAHIASEILHAIKEAFRVRKGEADERAAGLGGALYDIKEILEGAQYRGSTMFG